MTRVALELAEDGTLNVRGDLVFATVGSILQEGMSLIEGQQSLVIDMSGVDHSDSAGLALLLEWLERARGAGIRLSFRSVPESLMDIADLSNVQSLLVGNPA